MASVDQRSLFGFAGDPKLTDGLREVSDLVEHEKVPQSTTSRGVPNESSSRSRREEGVGGVSDRMLCSACQCPFETRDEQMDHYKLDWHRFNLRQRLSGRTPLLVEEFEKKMCTGDLSSISGSESEDEEVDDVGGDCHGDEGPEGGRSSSRVVFQNSQGQYVSLHRCVLQSSRTEADLDLVDSLLKVSVRTVWVILMTGGGHFAGAVFQGKEILQHKTFHRYTVRAKRGTAQSLRDGQNRSHTPKSAGAALRRYNEAALVKDIQELLKNWAEYLKQASAIFLRTPKCNRGVFFGGREAPLEKRDGRIRSLPFATRRATFSEIQRVHNVLSTLYIHDKTTGISRILSPGKRVWQKKMPNPAGHPPKNTAEEDEEQSSVDEGSVELEMVQLRLDTLELREHEVKLNRRRRRKKRERKKKPEDSQLTTRSISVEAEEEQVEEAPIDRTKLKKKLNNKKELLETEGEVWDYSVRDALYTACKTGDTATLHRLLQLPESPVEPMGPRHPNPPLTLLNTPINSTGFTLLHTASAAGQKHAVRLLLEAGSDPAYRDRSGQTPYAVAEKDTRNTFRKFMAENPNRYDYAKAQVPGPLTDEIEKKKVEKKKAQRAARKQREREQKKESRKEEEEEEEMKRFRSLSDREKRALAAERRLAEQAMTSGRILTNIRRCWQCGGSLLGKIPFEYLDFSFCSTCCVQNHRKAAAEARP